MKRSQASKSTGGKKAKQSDEPQQRGAASASKRTDWCSDCWALAQDGCLGAHRLVDFNTAQKTVADEMAVVQQEISDVQRKLDQVRLKMDPVQLRMNALAEGVLRSAPVLVAHVPLVESTCWSVGGGDIRITLASMEPLTAEDVEAVCEALEEVDLEYDRHGGPPARAGVDISGLDAVMVKLPRFAQGQKCEEGDLVLDAKGYLTVARKGAGSRDGAKLLGRVGKESIRTLSASTCGEGSDCQYSRYHAGIGDGTSLENVRRAD